MTALRTPRTVVGQLMTNDPVLVTADMPLADAAAIMEFYRISGLPVVDADGVLVGVVCRDGPRCALARRSRCGPRGRACWSDTS